MEGTLVLLGLLALAFTWLTALWGIEALFGIVSTVALVLSWAMRRLRSPGISDVLGGGRGGVPEPVLRYGIGRVRCGVGPPSGGLCCLYHVRSTRPSREKPSLASD